MTECPRLGTPAARRSPRYSAGCTSDGAAMGVTPVGVRSVTAKKPVVWWVAVGACCAERTGVSPKQMSLWGRRSVYIRLFACEKSHYLCTGTTRQAEITRNRLHRSCRLLRASGELVALDGTPALRCFPRRLVRSLTNHTSSRAPSHAATPPVPCGILPGKREPTRLRALESGRDVLYRVCVCGI